MQLGSAGLQHADERLEGDERVVLILDTRRDVETRQEWLRVGAELPDQVAVSPQVGRTDQAAHSINSLVSGNDKRSSEDVKTHGGTLDDPVSTTSCEYSRQGTRGSHEHTKLRRPDHRCRAARHRYG